MNQFEVGVQNYENLQNMLKDIPNSVLNFFLGKKEVHGFYRFEFTYKLPKNLELN